MKSKIMVVLTALLATISSGDPDSLPDLVAVPTLKKEKSSPATLAMSQSSAGEILCQANNDCIQTTFCCSSYSCVNPRTCLHGNKTELDVCDYNFECLSRCCVGGTCNHILECYS